MFVAPIETEPSESCHQPSRPSRDVSGNRCSETRFPRAQTDSPHDVPVSAAATSPPSRSSSSCSSQSDLSRSGAHTFFIRRPKTPPPVLSDLCSSGTQSGIYVVPQRRLGRSRESITSSSKSPRHVLNRKSASGCQKPPSPPPHMWKSSEDIITNEPTAANAPEDDELEAFLQICFDVEPIVANVSIENEADNFLGAYCDSSDDECSTPTVLYESSSFSSSSSVSSFVSSSSMSSSLSLEPSDLCDSSATPFIPKVFPMPESSLQMSQTHSPSPAPTPRPLPDVLLDSHQQREAVPDSLAVLHPPSFPPSSAAPLVDSTSSEPSIVSPAPHSSPPPADLPVTRLDPSPSTSVVAGLLPSSPPPPCAPALVPSPLAKRFVALPDLWLCFVLAVLLLMYTLPLSTPIAAGLLLASSSPFLSLLCDRTSDFDVLRLVHPRTTPRSERSLVGALQFEYLAQNRPHDDRMSHVSQDDDHQSRLHSSKDPAARVCHGSLGVRRTHSTFDQSDPLAAAVLPLDWRSERVRFESSRSAEDSSSPLEACFHHGVRRIRSVFDQNDSSTAAAPPLDLRCQRVRSVTTRGVEDLFRMLKACVSRNVHNGDLISTEDDAISLPRLSLESERPNDTPDESPGRESSSRASKERVQHDCRRIRLIPTKNEVVIAPPLSPNSQRERIVVEPLDEDSQSRRPSAVEDDPPEALSESKASDDSNVGFLTEFPPPASLDDTCLSSPFFFGVSAHSSSVLPPSSAFVESEIRDPCVCQGQEKLPHVPPVAPSLFRQVQICVLSILGAIFGHYLSTACFWTTASIKGRATTTSSAHRIRDSTRHPPSSVVRDFCFSTKDLAVSCISWFSERLGSVVESMLKVLDDCWTSLDRFRESHSAEFVGFDFRPQVLVWFRSSCLEEASDMKISSRTTNRWPMLESLQDLRSCLSFQWTFMPSPSSLVSQRSISPMTTPTIPFSQKPVCVTRDGHFLKSQGGERFVDSPAARNRRNVSPDFRRCFDRGFALSRIPQMFLL